MVDAAASVLAQYTCRVSVVDHDHRVMLLRALDDPGQRRDVAIHGKDAVSGDQLAPVLCCFLQRLLEGVEVAVLIDDAVGLRQPNAIDDARVVELIGDHDIALDQDAGEDAVA